MNDIEDTQEIEHKETDKVFEIAFSFRETLKGICVADSEQTVREGLTEKYKDLPDFTIDKLVELQTPEETKASVMASVTVPPSNTLN